MLQVLNMIGKVRIKFKVEVIDNACLVARAAHLMTHDEFAEGYSLIRDMQGSDFLTALRLLAEQEAMVLLCRPRPQRPRTSITRRSRAADQRPSCLRATRRGEIAMNIAKLQQLLQQPKDEAAK